MNGPEKRSGHRQGDKRPISRNNLKLLRRLTDSPGETPYEERIHAAITGFQDLVLIEDEGLLVVNKPAGIVSQGLGYRGVDMIDICRFATGSPDVSAVNRLDVWTSGVLVLGKDKRTRSGLGKQFIDKTASGVQKTYKALVDGAYPDGTPIRAEVFVDDSDERVHVVPEIFPGAKHTVTEITPVTLYTANHPDREPTHHSLTEVHLVTGRRHQIRAVLADLGNPIMGDWQYNPDASGASRQLLHSHTLEFRHPLTNEELHVQAPLPPDFTETQSGLIVVGNY